MLYNRCDMSTLDLTSLRNALRQLEEGIADAEKHADMEVVRDGAIQRFEYCYELCTKMIKRSLEVQFGDTVDQMNLRDVLRTAFERGLIADVAGWFDFRDERNKTAHTYDELIAAEVFQAAKHFLPEARFLLSKLEQANH